MGRDAGRSAPPRLPSLAALAGTTLVFRYSTNHNVWQLPSQRAFDACDFSEGRELAGVAYGGVAAADVERLGYANVFEARSVEAGTMYFACQVSDHCRKGQKVVVTVGSNGS